MPVRPAYVLLALMCVVPLQGQEAVPVIRAHSRVVSITDGLHVKKNYWQVMPERTPDIYYVEIPRRPHTVTFTTDVESISFAVTYGSQHDFVIRLDDGKEARTQVRAAYRSLPSYVRPPSAPARGPDVIPFTLGDNDKIYVKGGINGGPVLDFQFDLGAGGTLIKKSSVSKVSMRFDGTIRLRNSDGDNIVPTSSANQLEIAGLRWDKVDVAVADNMTWREDGLIGNSLFRDKIIEIDYDRMVIAIHDNELPPLSPEWIQQELILDGVVPFTRATLEIDGTRRDGWAMLDTGAYTSILNSAQLSPSSKMLRELRGMVGLRSSGPHLTIGQQSLTPNYSAKRYDGDASALGLWGNDVLKRFHLIIDNRHGHVYLRPNANLHAPFKNPEYYAVRIGVFTLAVLILATTWWIRRRAHA